MYKCNAGSLKDKVDLAFNKSQDNFKVKLCEIPRCTYTNTLAKTILRYFFFVLISIAYLSCSSQTFAPLGTYWTFGTGEFWVPGSYPTTWKVTRDTIVLGKPSRIIEITQGGNVYWDTTGIIIHGDSSLIQWFDPHENAFKTFIDFNADSGDIWFTNYPYRNYRKYCNGRVFVGSIDSINISGYMLKRMTVNIGDSAAYYGLSTIVEHIGFIGSIEHDGLYPGESSTQVCTGGITFDATEYYGLRCFEDSIIGFIDFIPNQNCDYNNVGIDQLSDNTEIKIYPNPSKNFLHVDVTTNKLPTLQYSIISGQGINLLSGILSINNRIDLTSLPAGIYSIKVSNSEAVYCESFIKK